MINLISWFFMLQFMGGSNFSSETAEKNVIVENKVETMVAKPSAEAVYDEISVSNDNMPSEKVFRYAMNGYEKITSEQDVRDDIITVVDFSLPSTEKRLWVIDLKSKKVLHNTLVAHGQGSGGNMADDFSNVPESHKSSIGFYLTNELYTGKHGLSLRLDGLEQGFNDNARARAIVMHGADYVSEDFIKRQGRLGRSFGCPAVPAELNEEIVKQISKKSVMFLYYPDYYYIKQSSFLNYASTPQQVINNAG